MTDTPPLTLLKDLLPQLNSVIIVLAPKPTYDQTASALSLFLGLRDMGKEVEIVCPDEMLVEVNQLVGVDVVKQKLGNKNLSISFEYQESAVEKVSYHIDEEKNRFYLIVKPQKGQKPLDTSTVSFDYIGAEADAVILVGVHNLEDLEHLYQGYESLYEQATLITLHSFEPSIGSIKLTTTGASCMSETVARMLEYLAIPVDSDMATNLLAGIEQSTKTFSSFTTTAETFETVAYLMKLGARRMKVFQATSPHPFSAALQNQGQKKEDTSPADPAQPPATSEKPATSASEGELVVEKNQKKSKQKHKQPQPKPGDLHYQPSGMGPGGGG